MTNASTLSRTSAANAASISRLLLACTTLISTLIFAAAAFRSLVMVSAFSFLGLTSSPKRLAAGSSSRSNPSCLGANSLNRKLTPVALPPGRRGVAGGEAEIARVWGRAENDGKACGRTLCGECRGGAHGNDPRHLAAQQFTGHGRQPIVLALRKPILDPQVVPLDIACLRQA